MKKNKISLGLDIGSISVKAVLATGDKIDRFACTRVLGKPLETARQIIDDIKAKFGKEAIANIVTTGSGGKTFSAEINATHINEFQAVCTSARFFYPEARTIFEIGGESSKYILLDETGIVDYGINGDCAAGTGSFIDQQAGRLHYNIEDIGGIVEDAKKTAKIAGRCSVFAKSDMIHAQQMGYAPAEVLRGLCLAVARNFKGSIVKGRKVEKPALFIGGVAQNSGVVSCMRELFDLNEKGLIVPKDPEFLGAVGAALFGLRSREALKVANQLKGSYLPDAGNITNDPLSTRDVIFLRDQIKTGELAKGKKTNVHMGLDIGSVSTNLVLMNDSGELIYDIYTRTKARPIEVVGDCLREVEEKFGDTIQVMSLGTTGSGRELIGELTGADSVKDEITAHKTGAIHISKTMTDGMVDTIFEIGGQDSKFIRIENGIVTDFTMNEACAAGTGSFLEEQAEKLGISIKDEFAELALSSKNPIKMGERCTVFMEKDVNSYQMRGNKIKDIVAGLAYSVVLNYLNRVVRGRNIGDTIFFQGGTAYNDAVAAAFAIVLGKKITVPPHNGVIGAVGAALLAKEHIEHTGKKTTFKGFDLTTVDYSIKEFTCKACTNECDVQEFTVDGSKTYWGDKCSSRYRKKSKSENKTVLADLVEARNNLIFDGFTENSAPNKKTIGIPRAMYFYDRFPFWHTYLSGLALNVVISSETNKKLAEAGLASRVSEPCHPIGVAHGHVKDLLDKGVDYIWLPNILTGEANGQTHVRPYLCPWGMTLPYVITSSPAFEQHKNKFIMPTLHHMHGEEFLSKQLLTVARELGASSKTHKVAFEKAILVQKKFKNALKTLGEMALHKLDETGRDAVVLIGRPYNLFDLHINLNVPTKIRSSYGVDVIPMDLLPVPETDITEYAQYMFWSYGKKILETAKFIGERKNLHMIYITNFKCGPDSFIKHFSKEASGKPFLTLQFDEHSNDAGIMTRIEAYLDSKGLLRKHNCKTERSTSLRGGVADEAIPRVNSGDCHGAKAPRNDRITS